MGFIISERGIEANPDKIKAIQEIPDDLTSLKEVPHLTGRLVALSRFISRSSKRCHRFFHVLKKNITFEWTLEYREALRELKHYLANALLLAKPEDGKTLLVYLGVSKVAVSAVLVREEDGKQQPIYYVSKTLLDAETRYPHLEKLALGLIMAARKLQPYFRCHPVAIVTTFPSRTILHKPNLLGK